MQSTAEGPGGGSRLAGQPAEAVMGRGWGRLGAPKGREMVGGQWRCRELRCAWREGVGAAGLWQG